MCIVEAVWVRVSCSSVFITLSSQRLDSWFLFEHGVEIKDSGGEGFRVDFLIIEEDGIRYSD
jgi:hypothetical protein